MVQAHAMVMILVWMIFISSGVLVARYGRSLRSKTQRQFLGKTVRFQIHRHLLSLAPLLILLGFNLILVRAGGKWVDPQIPLIRFAHSVLGDIVVCCAILQIWLVLYHCHPHSPFRYIFERGHHLLGLFSFVLSIPTIFLIIVLMFKGRIALITIISL